MAFYEPSSTGRFWSHSLIRGVHCPDSSYSYSYSYSYSRGGGGGADDQTQAEAVYRASPRTCRTRTQPAYAGSCGSGPQRGAPRAGIEQHVQPTFRGGVSAGVGAVGG